jgi:hypothetical protein
VHAAPDETLIAAGDIASCSNDGDEQTELLLDALPGTVAVLGDLAYNSGTTAEFNNCYDPSWGQHKARTKPSPGNHEYQTAGAAGYYGYFGAAAGDPTKGYYSYEIGAWHIVVINSNCGAIGGCAAGSAQEQWLRGDLAAHPAECTLAYWHHPRFSSGSTHGNNSSMQAIWQALYDYGAEVVLAGHEHNYERFGPQTATGIADAAYGIREFVVGTGGRGHYGFGTPKPNSEVRDGTSLGVLKLTLQDTAYQWEFIPVEGATFTDAGSGACHPAPADADSDAVLDLHDNCPDDANASQLNADRNFIELGPTKVFDDTTRAMSDNAGDACDSDDDSDGRSDDDEAAGVACGAFTTPTDALNPDTDGDRALDGAECARATDPASASSAPSLAQCGPTTDGDADGVVDFREDCYYGTSTASANSDGDGCGDGREVASINADTAVNVIDLQQIAGAAGPHTDPDYLVQFDVTKSGSIDVIDLQVTALHAGACP